MRGFLHCRCGIGPAAQPGEINCIRVYEQPDRDGLYTSCSAYTIRAAILLDVERPCPTWRPRRGEEVATANMPEIRQWQCPHCLAWTSLDVGQAKSEIVPIPGNSQKLQGLFVTVTV